MARPKKTDATDLSKPIDLTVGWLERLTCPDGKAQAFLRDAKAPGLRVRVTSAGAKSFVFESKLNRQTIRRTIGDVRDWTIEAARAEARRLAVLIDDNTDPRELEREQEAAKVAAKAAQEAARIEAERQAVAESVTVGDAWAVYVAERTPKWGERHARDHESLSAPGGRASTRGTRGRGVTIAGPLHALMGLRLKDLDAATVAAWIEREAITRPTPTRLAARLLRAFTSWCAEHEQYSALVPLNPVKSRKVRDALPQSRAKDDALTREQLPAWFEAVRGIRNPAIAAYVQVLLLTGARPGEIRRVQWPDVNERWRGLTIRDKVEGERVIPLTPYVASLLNGLPRRGPYVFAGAKGEAITEPNKPHALACAAAGVPAVTLHGLRRSFKSLTEWLEVPAGVVAQIQGHKPSATAEKHYTVRPLDLLRLHHERIEAWILEQAGIPAPSATDAAVRLRAV